MTIENRRDREKQQMKELILQTAADIILAEGFEKLSIRKIANQIEYSPANIYHYFQNKNEIIGQILRRGHRDFTSALSEGLTETASPEDRLKMLVRSYIETALADPDQYLTVQLNGSPEVLEVTAYMFENAAEEKPTLRILFEAVKKIAGGNIPDSEIEMISQIIAASSLGLVTRLSLEKNIGETRKNQLIGRFTDAAVRMASLRNESPEEK
jgi:AcrR family transcriptional regulator